MYIHYIHIYEPLDKFTVADFLTSQSCQNTKWYLKTGRTESKTISSFYESCRFYHCLYPKLFRKFIVGEFWTLHYISSLSTKPLPHPEMITYLIHIFTLSLWSLWDTFYGQTGDIEDLNGVSILTNESLCFLQHAYITSGCLPVSKQTTFPGLSHFLWSDS